jgi:hypothetical protein
MLLSSHCPAIHSTPLHEMEVCDGGIAARILNLGHSITCEWATDTHWIGGWRAERDPALILCIVFPLPGIEHRFLGRIACSLLTSSCFSLLFRLIYFANDWFSTKQQDARNKLHSVKLLKLYSSLNNIREMGATCSIHKLSEICITFWLKPLNGKTSWNAHAEDCMRGYY